MALYKDGKVYRTLEQQVGHLTKAHNEQLEINLSVESDINNLENAVEGKQDKLTFDTIPVDGSTNPVESNGIYDALAGKLDKGDEVFVVELSSSSGTLTDSDYDLLLLNNTIIKLTISTVSYYLNKIGETSSSLRYGCVQNDTSRIYILTITKSTKEYSVTNKEITIAEDGVFVIPSGDIVGKVLTVNSSYKSEWKDLPSVTSNDIDSETATSGQVLAANGSGGASWQTPSGGGIPTVTITNQYAQLSQDDWDTLYNNNPSCIIFSGNCYIKGFTDGGSQQMSFVYWHKNTSGFYFMNIIEVYSSRYINLINGSSARPDLNKFYSGSATNGQVLTADGSGGANWQNAGGKTLYLHNWHLTTSAGMKIMITIVSDKNSAYNRSAMQTYLSSNTSSSTYINCVGFGYDTVNSKWYHFYGCYINNNILYLYYLDETNTGQEVNFGTFSTYAVSDKFIEI